MEERLDDAIHVLRNHAGDTGGPGAMGIHPGQSMPPGMMPGPHSNGFMPPGSMGGPHYTPGMGMMDSMVGGDLLLCKISQVFKYTWETDR